MAQFTELRPYPLNHLSSFPEVKQHFTHRKKSTNLGLWRSSFTDSTNLVGVPADLHNGHLVDFLNAGGYGFDAGLEPFAFE